MLLPSFLIYFLFAYEKVSFSFTSQEHFPAQQFKLSVLAVLVSRVQVHTLLYAHCLPQLLQKLTKSNWKHDLSTLELQLINCSRDQHVYKLCVCPGASSRNGSLRMAGKKAARDAVFPHLPPPHSSCWFAGPEVEVVAHRCGTHHPQGQIVANQQCFHQLSSPLLHWSFPASVEFELHNNQARWVIVVLKLSHWHFMLLVFFTFAPVLEVLPLLWHFSSTYWCATYPLAADWHRKRMLDHEKHFLCFSTERSED